jgi:hypothetical protein
MFCRARDQCAILASLSVELGGAALQLGQARLLGQALAEQLRDIADLLADQGDLPYLGGDLPLQPLHFLGELRVALLQDLRLTFHLVEAGLKDRRFRLDQARDLRFAAVNEQRRGKFDLRRVERLGVARPRMIEEPIMTPPLAS